jgi:hypothetical protein
MRFPPVQPVQTCAKAPAQVSSLKTSVKSSTCARVQRFRRVPAGNFKMRGGLSRKIVHPCTGQRFSVEYQYFNLCTQFCTGPHRCTGGVG